MQRYLLFQSSFKATINQYCKNLKYDNFTLTDAEYEQLNWYTNSQTITPQATANVLDNKLHPEIERGLARRYSFELLLQGDEPAYRKFIQMQTEPVLTSNDFQCLAQEAKSLSPDIITLIRTSCLLSVVNEKINEFNEKYHWNISRDSEIALSQFSEILAENPAYFPITKNFTKEQCGLLPKMYWPGLHFRHLLFTEGGENMIASLKKGRLEQTFTEEAFTLWKWRWLTNTFGFQNGPGAKYYNADIHHLSNVLLIELTKLFENPNYKFLDNYLLMRANLAQLDVSNDNEKKLLGHIAAYFNRINIITPKLGKALLVGYQLYQANFFDDGQLAELYNHYYHQQNLITPTYVPAILNNAFLILRKTFDEETAIQKATNFMCQFLHDMHLQLQNNPGYLSCMDFSQEKNLNIILEIWLQNPKEIKFTLYTTNNNNFMVEYVLQEQPKCGYRL